MRQLNAMQIIIEVLYNATFETHTFADDYRGNQKANKLIDSLHEKVVNDPYYFNLKKIETLKTKLAGYILRRGTKARMDAEINLRFYEEQRAEELAGYVDIKKPFLRVNIFKK